MKKVAVIGAGNWGRNIVRTLYEINALDSITELNQSLKEKILTEIGSVIAYSSVEEMLEATDAPVAIATPVSTHFSIAKFLLERGRDVFIEKPMAMNTQECAELNSLAKKNNCLIMVGHLLIYQPAISFIKEYIAQGKLGKIYSIYQARKNLGTVRTHENALYSLGVHDFAVLDFLLAETPTTIKATGQAVLTPGVEDDVHVHMSFSSGIETHLHNSWLWSNKERFLQVNGEKGFLRFDELTQEVKLFPYKLDKNYKVFASEPEVVFYNEAQPLTTEMLHFIECCEQRLTPMSDGLQGERVVGMLEDSMQQIRSTKCQEEVVSV